MRARLTAQAADMAAYATRKKAELGALTGTVLEIGAGTGANFGYFRRGICWLGLEPHLGRARELASTAARYGHHGPVLAAPAERIPHGDGSVNAVAATLALCSVADQDAVLAEVRRVLRPAGPFVFFEHVAAPAGSWSRLLQRCAAPVTRLFDGGCDPGRETWRAIETAGFRELDAGWYTSRPGLGLYHRYFGGVAYA